MTKSEEKYDLIIIGGGPAGLTAAIYAARRQLKTLIITKEIGGQMVITNQVENYPGFESISGFDLMAKFKKQAEAGAAGRAPVEERVRPGDALGSQPGRAARVEQQRVLAHDVADPRRLDRRRLPQGLGSRGDRQALGPGGARPGRQIQQCR